MNAVTVYPSVSGRSPRCSTPFERGLRDGSYWDEADIQNLIPPSPLAPTLSPHLAHPAALC
jgi:hypothetical protein